MGLRQVLLLNHTPELVDGASLASQSGFLLLSQRLVLRSEFVNDSEVN
jgi:hypothetical protein